MKKVYCTVLAIDEDVLLARALRVALREENITPQSLPPHADIREDGVPDSIRRIIDRSLFVLIVLSPEFETSETMRAVIKYAFSTHKMLLPYKTYPGKLGYGLQIMLGQSHWLDVSLKKDARDGIPDLRRAAAIHRKTYLEEAERSDKRRIRILIGALAVFMLCLLPFCCSSETENTETSADVASVKEPLPQERKKARLAKIPAVVRERQSQLLLEALNARDLTAAESALLRGADPDTRFTNAPQGTLLESAAWHGLPEFVALLLIYGADPTLKAAHGRDPMSTLFVDKDSPSRKNGSGAIIAEMLCDFGFPVNNENHWKATYLTDAVHWDARDVAEVLVRYGALPEKVGQNAQSARSKAYQKKDGTLTQWLSVLKEPDIPKKPTYGGGRTYFYLKTPDDPAPQKRRQPPLLRLANIPAGTLPDGPRVEAFKIGITEVTQAQYSSVTGQNPSNFRDDPLRPVEQVSWQDAIDFCNKLTQIAREAGRISANEKYTLPTAAQWEYACRAGTTTKFSFGTSDARARDYGWFLENSDRQTHPVARKHSNAFNLYDMHGNVWEWCLDSPREAFGDKAAEKFVANITPKTEVWAKSKEYFTKQLSGDTQNLRIFRGGNWNFTPDYGASAAWSYTAETGRAKDLGFRVVLVPDKPATKVVQTPTAAQQKTPTAKAPANNRPEAALHAKLFDLTRSRSGAVTCSASNLSQRRQALHNALQALERNKYRLTTMTENHPASASVSTELLFAHQAPNGKALTATDLTQAFFAPQMSAKSSAVLAVYAGIISPKVTGTYRFVGAGDDALLVGLDGETVFYGYWPGEGHGPAITEPPTAYWEPANHCQLDGRGSGSGSTVLSHLFKGSWVKLEKGKKYRICIALGEATGGFTGAILGIEHKERPRYDVFGRIPLFKIGEVLNEFQRGNVANQNKYTFDGPVFFAESTTFDRLAEIDAAAEKKEAEVEKTPDDKKNTDSGKSTNDDTESDSRISWRDRFPSGWIAAANPQRKVLPSQKNLSEKCVLIYSPSDGLDKNTRSLQGKFSPQITPFILPVADPGYLDSEDDVNLDYGYRIPWENRGILAEKFDYCDFALLDNAGNLLVSGDFSDTDCFTAIENAARNALGKPPLPEKKTETDTEKKTTTAAATTTGTTASTSATPTTKPAPGDINATWGKIFPNGLLPYGAPLRQARCDNNFKEMFRTKYILVYSLNLYSADSDYDKAFRSLSSFFRKYKNDFTPVLKNYGTYLQKGIQNKPTLTGYAAPDWKQTYSDVFTSNTSDSSGRYSSANYLGFTGTLYETATGKPVYPLGSTYTLGERVGKELENTIRRFLKK